MRKRNYQFEILQVVLSAAVIILTVVLFFKSDELTILFPAVFAIAALLCLLAAMEGTAYNRDRVIRKSRIVLFGILTVILGILTYVSFRVVL